MPVGIIGLLVLTSIPTVTGCSLAISGQRDQQNREKDATRMKKFHIDVYCGSKSSRVKEVHGHRLVLKNDRVWVGPVEALNPCSAGYVTESFYIEYPDPERVPVPIGLVSQVAVDPPLLNWIYVDLNTKELKYGNKTASIAHDVGPYDWTEDQEHITFDEEECFTVVEDPVTKRWQLYWDADDNGLAEYVPKGRRKLQVRLVRTLIPGE